MPLPVDQQHRAACPSVLRQREQVIDIGVSVFAQCRTSSLPWPINDGQIVDAPRQLAGGIKLCRDRPAAMPGDLAIGARIIGEWLQTEARFLV